MRILLALSSPEYLRHYDTTIEALAGRGHDVIVAVGAVHAGKPVRLDGLGEASPRLTVAGLVPPRGDQWTACARAIRGTMDFVHYWHPDLASATALRARVKRQALPSALQALDGIHAVRPRRLARIMNGLALLERAVPPARALFDFLDVHLPDLVLVSPLIEPASDQMDLVKAAQAKGLRVVTLIASWDNLTNKGDLRLPTDLVVWNEAQKREAVEYHRVAPDRIVVTGAQTFDRWFDRGPSRTRAAFCDAVGLDAGRPFVLFTGSSIFIARADAEMAFVRRWIDALRASSDPAVRDLGVLVRPHPYNGRAWTPELFAELPSVAVWPRGGYDPVDAASREGLFDSLYHCAAVVGINTSAMIEAAIVGRPVLTIVDSSFAATQEGTRHFHHLLPEHGGFLRVARTLDEHLSQLADIRRDPQAAGQELSRFVGTFIRPHGIGQPATPVLVEALERFGGRPAPGSARVPFASLLIRPLLYLLRRWHTGLASPADRKRLSSRRTAAGPARRHPDTATPAGGRTPRIAAVAMFVPPVVATLVATAFAIAETAGRAPFSYAPPRNVAEAAGMAMESEMLRFIRQGQDPAAVYDIRPDIISSSITRATGLEAAIWSRRLRLIGILEREGAFDDAATRHRLVCLARDIRADELASRLAGETDVSCQAGHASDLVEARSR